MLERPLKICVTMFSSPWSPLRGGGQLAAHDLAAALHALGHEVHALYSRRPREELRPLPVAPYRFHFATQHKLGALYSDPLSFVPVLARLAARERFDVIHGNAEEAFAAGWIARATGARFVATMHATRLPNDSLFSAARRDAGGAFAELDYHFLRSTLRRAERIFAYSQFARGLVYQALGSRVGERVRVLSPGIAPEWFDVVRAPSDEVRLVSWSRLVDVKGIRELIEVIARLSRESPVHLTLFGDGPQASEYRDLARERGVADRLEFRGLADPAAIRAAASKARAAIFLTRAESFGLSIAEAAAMGLPVVATRIGSVPELIADGDTGTLVDVDDLDGTCAAVRALVHSPERAMKMAQAARESMRTRLSWQRAAEQCVDAYREILTGPPA